jgi:UPF0716 protein FxsA
VLLWAAAEIYCMVLVARATSGLLVIALLFAGVLVGSALLRRAGAAALRNAMRRAQPASASASASGSAGSGEAEAAPSGQRLGNTAAAGVFLMIPGFLTDVLGLLCLFPPTGALLARIPQRLLNRNPTVQQVRIHRPDGKVVQGEVVDPEQGPYDYHNPPPPGDPGADRRPPLER